MNKRITKITLVALIAALYTVISLIIAPLAYGQIQIRVSEALTILPCISVLGVYGVTLGCLLTNFIGALMGVNLLGFIDVFIGTFATLIAAILSFKLRNYRWLGLPIFAMIPVILVNALIIGLELTYFYLGSFDLNLLLVNIVYVGIGQVISVIIGLLIYKPLAKVFVKTFKT
ncbi:MAG: QueT transporter family protein [Erysipelotrichaceae bacterium]